MKQFFDYSSLKIESSFEIPLGHTEVRSKVAILISRLNVGDSFVIPIPAQYAILQTYAKKAGYLLRLRNTGTKGAPIYRVWRIK